jgi:N-acetylmuramoyl-L-alanine amidase
VKRWLLAIAAGLLTVACSSAAGPAQQPPLAEPASPTITPPDSPTPARTASSGPQSGKPLAGKIVGIDPGHNGLNGANPAYINRLIWNGRESETCDTTGTQTAGGYTEARFNFNVARYLRADLQSAGARVVMTRTNNHGVGPCVNRRAEILDRAHAAVAIDIHADGGPVSGRGFTVLEPIADGINNHVIKSSARFGSDVRSAMLKHTSMPESNYYGINGIEGRDNLAGLNLTTVPKVLLECGNMQNATDAALLTTPRFQRRLAAALEAAIVAFLTQR